MKPRFTLRDLLWLTLALGLCISWYLEQSRHRSWRQEPIDRSWHSGSVDVSFEHDEHSFDLRVDAKWPEVSPDLWIRGNLWMTQATGEEWFMLGEEGKKLSDFRHMSILGGWEGFLKKPEPEQAVFDYEIWQGRPGRGRLLAKQSVFSTSDDQETKGPKPMPVN